MLESRCDILHIASCACRLQSISQSSAYLILSRSSLRIISTSRSTATQASGFNDRSRWLYQAPPTTRLRGASLLDLPAELRAKIFEYLFEGEIIILRNHRYHDPTTYSVIEVLDDSRMQCPGTLLACRALSYEALPTLVPTLAACTLLRLENMCPSLDMIFP